MGAIEELEDDYEEPPPKYPYKIGESKQLGRFLEATRDIQKGEVLWSEKPLVVAPVAVTPPVCLSCYTPVDGSYK